MASATIDIVAAGAQRPPIAIFEAAAWPARPGRQILAVTSGKGGVGKTNISAGLSILLSQAGLDVALVDADLGLGNLDVLLGGSAGPSMADVMAGRRSLEQILIELPCGAKLAPGGSGAVFAHKADPAWRDKLLHDLVRLRNVHDLVLIDCGSGIGQDVIDLCMLADHMLVITTPEPTAMTDAYGLIKTLHRQGQAGRMSLLVNMAASHQEAKAAFARISSVASHFLGRTVFDAGHILADAKVPLAVRNRQPFVVDHPGCRASRCLKALAAKMQPQGIIREKERDGLLGKIMRIFR